MAARAAEAHMNTNVERKLTAARPYTGLVANSVHSTGRAAPDRESGRRYALTNANEASRQKNPGPLLRLKARNLRACNQSSAWRAVTHVLLGQQLDGAQYGAHLRDDFLLCKDII